MTASLWEMVATDAQVARRRVRNIKSRCEVYSDYRDGVGRVGTTHIWGGLQLVGACDREEVA